MITWRGFATVKQRRSGLRFGLVEVRCKLQAYDTTAPDVVLSQVRQTFAWMLDDLAGLSQGQLANKILNTGLIRMVDPPGGGPQVPVGPDPPPLRGEGNEFLQGLNDGLELIRDVAFPKNFGP